MHAPQKSQLMMGKSASSWALLWQVVAVKGKRAKQMQQMQPGGAQVSGQHFNKSALILHESWSETMIQANVTSRNAQSWLLLTGTANARD